MNTVKLFLFPHAGGAPSYYVPLAREFTSGVRRIAVPYPGRDGAHDVATLSSIEELVDGLWRKLSPERVDDGSPIAFFGHSMGSLVAFEMARRFAEAGRPVDALFVSACAAPGHAGFDDVADSDDGLLGAAASMTGIDAALLEHDAFASRILPTLRGFRAITRYRAPDEAVLNCPIRAYVGESDEIATVNNMSKWASRTVSGFGMRIFTGHHFYLSDHLATLAADIETSLDAAVVPADEDRRRIHGSS
ncbi:MULTISPECIES: thioesterase II family protein [Tsukamurella]|uniref:Thioesterase TesA n=1 Tax=Tsukamurella strandjordii TaxID=147577 RepID=A0AA90NI03_9ACTN|nr:MULTISPECIES: alpha/beta fold hydrolase [Tsukamurella]MDP0398895.1 alpha/beta fold hydrolase [Tsukamurella strandjordii]GIZ99331.1 putative thioesterase TesA [Tsukamurella sp. TY48]